MGQGEEKVVIEVEGTERENGEEPTTRYAYLVELEKNTMRRTLCWSSKDCVA